MVREYNSAQYGFCFLFELCTWLAVSSGNETLFTAATMFLPVSIVLQHPQTPSCEVNNIQAQAQAIA